jgi:glutathione peroxidase-family protein
LINTYKRFGFKKLGYECNIFSGETNEEESTREITAYDFTIMFVEITEKYLSGLLKNMYSHISVDDLVNKLK